MKLEELLANLHDILSPRAESGSYSIKEVSGRIEVETVDYFWTKDDEIVESKYVHDYQTYYVDYDNEGNTIVRKGEIY